jgi:hypothetical protein
VPPTSALIVLLFRHRASVVVAPGAQELPLHRLRVPFSEYKHYVLVYPLSVNVSSTPHRNIACRVELLDRHGVAQANQLAQGGASPPPRLEGDWRTALMCHGRWSQASSPSCATEVP